MSNKKTTKKDLVKKEASPLANPASAGRGFDDPNDKDDLIIPRAKLLQAQSPEVIEKNMDQGLIINSITKDVLPEIFIPIFRFVNWIRFNPRNKKEAGYDSNFEPGAVIWRSDDPTDPKVLEEGQFGKNGERPLATKFLNFLSYFPGHPMPVVISFCNTSMKAGKQFYSMAKYAGGDMFSRQYKLNSKQSKNDLGTFFVLTVDPAGMTEDKDYKVAESWYNSLSMKPLKVHEEAEDKAEDDIEL